MANHSRYLVVCATAGLLALAGASVLSAQQQPRDTLQTGAVTPNDSMTPPAVKDSMKPPAVKADTALRAKPGLQTGPAMNDTTTRMPTDTAKPPAGRVDSKNPSGFQYHGPPSDTALHARPGTQTGKTLGDSTKTTRKKHHRWHKKATSDTTKSQSDTTRSH